LQAPHPPRAWTQTLIKRRDFTTPSPLTTISNEDIAFTGQPTLEETLNQMPQVLPEFGRTSNNPTLGNNPGIGGAGVDLRGFGPNRTLVLLNGRRVAPSGTGNGVDLNNLPQFLVERVEVITGGTSTVYGSDAIAGLVNFITRQDYSGFGVEAGVSMAEPGDAETYDINLAYGHNFASGRGNVTVFANMLERKSLLAGDREFTRIAWTDDWQGNLVEGGSTRTPGGHIVFPRADLGSGPAGVTFNKDGTPRSFVWPDDAYNYQPVNYLQIPLTRVAAGVMGHYDLSDRFEAYLEASFTRNEPIQSLAPVPADLPTATTNLDNPLLAPETRQLFTDNYSCDPNRACFNFRRRMLELGPRRIENERDYTRIVAGFRGELWQDWDIDGWVTYTTADLTEKQQNDASRSRLLQGLLVDPATNGCIDPSGGCAPLNVFGEGNLSAEGVEFIRYADFVNITERTQKLASVFVTGSPVDTWAGALDMAVGLEWRSDDTYFKSDDALVAGDALGYNSQSSVNGVEEVFEIYTEAVVPLASDLAWAQYLGLEVGVRYSDYKNAGPMWTYKAGGEWQPIESLRLRAMHQRSARAPNSLELFEEQFTQIGTMVGSNSSQDPCSASADPVGNGNAEKCILTGLPADQLGTFEAIPRYPVEYLLGGNPNLVPEEGETWTVGAVISPEALPNWTFTIDYFALEVTDTIGGINSFSICFDPLNTDNLFCEDLSRDASGNVSRIADLTGNRGLLETNGIDTQVQYATDLPPSLGLGDRGADLSLNIYWTHMLTNNEQENPVTQIIECAGYFGWPCDNDARAAVYPENRVTTNVHYASGPLGLHLTWRWIDGTENRTPLGAEIYFNFSDLEPAIPSVDDKHYLDLGFAYDFSDWLTARFGVNNLLDNDPPMMADAVWDNNTDAGLFDVFGRSYYLTLSAQFARD
jgi:outer membrane receptor protein involved in Fe transport